MNTGNFQNTPNEELKRLKAENNKLNEILKDKEISLETAHAFYKEIEYKLKKAEATEEKLNQLLEISTEAVFFLNTDGTIAYCNHSSLSKFAYKSENQLIGKSFYKLVAPEDLVKVRSFFNNTLHPKNLTTLESEYLTAEGKTFTGEASCSIIRKNTEQILITILDVGFRKQTRQDNRQSIDFLIKLSLIQGELNNAENINALKDSICRQLLDLTLASEAWILAPAPLGHYLLTLANFGDTDKKFRLVNTEIEQNQTSADFFEMHKILNGGYLLENSRIIHLNNFQEAGAIRFQYLINLRLKNEEYLQVGLNFYAPISKDQVDFKLLQNLHVHLNSAFNTMSAREKLRENEIKYRAFTEKIKDVTLLMNLDRKYTYVSPSVEQFGYSADDVLDKTPRDLIAPEDYEIVSCAVNDLIPYIGKTVQLEKIRINPKIRPETYTELHITNMLNMKGVEGIVINVRDVTERVVYEKKIKANEARLHNIFESMRDSVYLCSQNFTIEYMNKPMIEQFGENYRGQKCFNFIYGFSSKCEWCVAEKLKEGYHELVEVQNPKNNRYYQISKSLISSDLGQSILHISRDVTELKKSELLIKQNEEKFRNIFNNSNDAIFITDNNGRYLEVNEIALKRAGFTREQFLVKHLTDMNNYRKTGNVNDYLREVLESGYTTAELTYTRETDNMEIHTEINGKVIEYLGETAILHISRDITQRKKLEREIIESTIRTEEAERSRFARDLHDGIGPYLSASKLMLQSITLTKEKEERDKITRKAVSAIDEIIRNIKEISNNISPHVLENFGLTAALYSFTKKLTVAAPKINISSNLNDKRIERNLEITLFRILIELINNTIKYAEADKIDITVMLTDKVLNIQYYDNGNGFDIEKTLNEKRGSGLFNIIVRIKSFNGEYDFVTAENQSFYFKARFKNITVK